MDQMQLLSLEAVRPRLFPMLLPLRRVAAMGHGQMVARELATGLAVAYVEDTGPNDLRYITWADLQYWGIGHDGLHQIAVWNLERQSLPLCPVVIEPPGTRDPMFIWNVQDGYDAARILLHHWIAEVAGLVRGELLLAAPERHWLVATGDDDPAKTQAVLRLTRQRYEQADFALSPFVYRWTGDRLEVVAS